MGMADLNVNGKKYKVDVDPETPLLWVIRDHVGLTGTKYGCGVGQCRLGAEYGEDLFRVFLPVGGGMQIAAGFEA